MSEEKKSSSEELASVEERLTAARAQLAQIQELLNAATMAKAAIDAAQTQIATITADVQSKQTDVQTISTLATAAKTQITDAQAVIETKSQHIEDARVHADKVRGELDKAQTAVTSKANEVDSAKTQAAAAADAARNAQQQCDANAGTVKKALQTATEDAAKTRKLADTAVATEERIAAYETSLAELNVQAKEKLAEIVGLLPGATSAGLAHAFDARGKLFTAPANLWQKIFVGALIGIVLIAATGLYQVHQHADSLAYSDLLKLWLARLPIAGALVWLALYASREAALAKHLEEDYAYKAAVSTSFQGFQEQMKLVQKEASPNTPLGKLCADTLSTIASPPGRIYDKHRLTTSPSSELVDVLNQALKAVANKKTE